MTEPELKSLMNRLGRVIGATHQATEVESPMFALLLFNDPQIAQYVCNCDRRDVITAMRETADRLERNEILERVEFPDGETLGATGDFPAGKLHERDEGGINFAIGSDKKLGKVLINFGKPTAWLGMNAKEAFEMAETLRWHASKIGF